MVAVPLGLKYHRTTISQHFYYKKTFIDDFNGEIEKKNS